MEVETFNTVGGVRLANYEFHAEEHRRTIIHKELFNTTVLAILLSVLIASIYKKHSPDEIGS